MLWIRSYWASENTLYVLQFSSVQSHSCVRLFATPWTAARQASLSITNSWSSLKLTSIELVMPSNHLILCHPLLLPPLIFPSIRVFSNESALCNRWPKYWSFSFNVSPSSEHPGLNSFRMDWLDLLAVQGTLKSLLQHHSSKASVLWCSAFFLVQLSHPYMTTGKTIALTRWTFVSKIMSLLHSRTLLFYYVIFLNNVHLNSHSCMQNIKTKEGIPHSWSKAFISYESYRYSFLIYPQKLSPKGTMSSIFPKG